VALRHPKYITYFTPQSRSNERGQDSPYFVDAEMGGIVLEEDDIDHLQVHGSVEAYHTPGNQPDHPQNPPVKGILPYSRLSAETGEVGFANELGLFDFEISEDQGIDPLVSVDLQGELIYVVDYYSSGDDNIREQWPILDGEMSIVLNEQPSEYSTSQINAFRNTNMTREFFVSRVGRWDYLQAPLMAVVNVDLGEPFSGCNAIYGGSLAFFASDDECFNAVSTTVVSHEYGHHIQHGLGINHFAFAEGYSDSLAEMVFDTPIIGEHFF